MNSPYKQAIVVILGPTGVGKTDLSILISKEIPVEIISADSRQIYKLLDIGTAKPSPQILNEIPHHFINYLDLDQYYSAGQFGKEARSKIMQIFARGRIPLIVGGSGLYIRALLKGFFDGNVVNLEIRQSLQKRLEEEGSKALYKELLELDRESASKIHPNNSKRVLRALEVCLVTGKKFSNLQKKKSSPIPYRILKFGINKSRNKLYQDINSRVDLMFQNGLVSEVTRIIELGYDINLNSINTVGYKEVIRLLNGEIDQNKCIEQVKQNSRRYAKRQLTWFRTEKNIQWYIIENSEDLKMVASDIVNAISNFKILK